jgi:hypothetical protein
MWMTVRRQGVVGLVYCAVVMETARHRVAMKTQGEVEDGFADDDPDDGQDTDKAALPCSVQVLDTPAFVEGPDEDTRHSSWETWTAYLNEYSKRTSQIIRVLNTVSCKVRNGRLAVTVAAREGRHVPFVPMEWMYYQRTYICTHGWPSNDRSTGNRPKHFVRGYACPFRFVVQQVKDKVWALQVKHGVYQHDHALGHEHFRTYADTGGLSARKPRQRSVK